jgi:hypothetical protein
VGASIVRKTPGTALYSSYVSTLWEGLSVLESAYEAAGGRGDFLGMGIYVTHKLSFSLLCLKAVLNITYSRVSLWKFMPAPYITKSTHRYYISYSPVALFLTSAKDDLGNESVVSLHRHIATVYCMVHPLVAKPTPTSGCVVILPPRLQLLVLSVIASIHRFGNRDDMHVMVTDSFNIYT